MDAIKQAERAIDHHYKHGCIIFKKNKIISKGFNKKRYVPSLKQYGYEPYFFPHSETDAILKADRDELVGSSALIVRKSKTKLGNSKPCRHCLQLLCDCGIKIVYYSDTDGHVKEMRL